MMRCSYTVTSTLTANRNIQMPIYNTIYIKSPQTCTNLCPPIVFPPTSLASENPPTSLNLKRRRR